MKKDKHSQGILKFCKKIIGAKWAIIAFRDLFDNRYNNYYNAYQAHL